MSGENGAGMDLEELQSQLTGRVALLAAGLGSFTGAMIMIQRPFPAAWFSLMAALVVIGFAARMLLDRFAGLARHVLVWGLTATLLAAMVLLAAPWVPFLGLALPFVGAVLVPGGEFAVGALVAAAAWGLVRAGQRAYPLPQLAGAVGVSVLLATVVARTLLTALAWAWTTQQRADRLLQVARQRQGELSRALQSLDKTNWILRRVQRELIAARAEAEEARMLKEQFAANVSHELRTPLNLVLGFSELMVLSPEIYGEVDWPPALRRDLREIYRASRHLVELIDDILDLSRFEITGFALNRERAPLEPLLLEAVDIASDLFRGQAVRLEVDIAPDLPALDVDRTRIRQVVLNLLTNAARFTERGVVRLAAQRGQGEVIVSVSDTGPGIPPEQLPHLFKQFYQVDRSLQRKHSGAGLGLAICKHFVEAHDGRIWAESEVGVGSTFYFALPIPDERVPAASLRRTGGLRASRDDGHATLLVVDPDPMVARLIRRRVEDCEVVHVADPAEVAAAAALYQPRAIVWNRPPAAPARHDSPTSAALPTPVIECSLPSHAWMMEELAVKGCLTKPITAERLLAEIERIGGVREVLIADDERGFCYLVERMLETSGRGFAVRRAYDGRHALEEMRARRPDLLLLDLMMPTADGFEVLDAMRSDPALADIPVIVVTATSYAEDALAHRASELRLRAPDGLRPGEALRCVRALIDSLEARHPSRPLAEGGAPNGALEDAQAAQRP